MKPFAAPFDVQSTVQGQKIKMGIEEAAMGHVMSILSDMYANKVRAIVREYSTNAADAQVVAGVQRPIEVTLPTGLSQFFRVRDYGIGLDREGIENVYSKYGASTKHTNNDLNGMLGIGCKSALAYQTQFLVSSTKNGKRIEVAVGRDEDGSGFMNVQTEYTTTDPDGTTVSVPVERQDIDRFSTEAHDFFKVWPSGSVLIDDAEPVALVGLKVADGIFIDENGEYGAGQIVMSNVAYPCPELSTLRFAGAPVIAYVGAGEVEFAPSREALKDTNLTRSTIEAIKARFRAGITTAAQKEIDACPNVWEAVEKMKHWDRYVRGVLGVYTYGGVELAREVEAPEFNPLRFTPASYASGATYKITNRFNTFDLTRDAVFRGSMDRSATARLDIGQVVHGLFVTNYKPEKYVADHHRKVRKYCADNNIPDAYNLAVMCREGLPSTPWIGQTVDWEVIRKIRLEPRAVASSGRIPGSYDMYTEADTFSSYNGRRTSKFGRFGVAGSDIRPDVPLFHAQGQNRDMHRYAVLLHSIMPAFTLVCLPGNRITKWEREVTRSVKVMDQMTKLLNDWKAALDADTRTAMSMAHSGLLQNVRSLSANKINDPALKAAIRVAKMENIEKVAVEASTVMRNFSGVLHVEELHAANPMENYPLFDWRVFKYHPDHCYTYINAAYAAV